MIKARYYKAPINLSNYKGIKLLFIVGDTESPNQSLSSSDNEMGPQLFESLSLHRSSIIQLARSHSPGYWQAKTFQKESVIENEEAMIAVPHKKSVNELMKAYYELQDKREFMKEATRKNSEKKIIKQVL